MTAFAEYKYVKALFHMHTIIHIYTSTYVFIQGWTKYLEYLLNSRKVHLLWSWSSFSLLYSFNSSRN